MEPTANPALDATALTAVLDLIPHALIEVDTLGVAHWANSGWSEITGQEVAEWQGTGWLDILASSEQSTRWNEIRAAGHEGNTYESDWTVLDRETGPHQLRVVAVPDISDGRWHGSVITIDDVTVERAQTSDLMHRATRDPLTGVYNRAQFNGFVERALERNRREPRMRAAVVFVDVDDLKTTNDSFGHGEGDRVLQAVAERLTSALRPDDIVARYGGDEFAVLCQALSNDDEAAVIADRLRVAVHQPYDGAGSCRISVGVATVQGSLHVSDVMSRADDAMYEEKRHRHASAEPTSSTFDEVLEPLRALAAFAADADLGGDSTATEVGRSVAEVGRSAQHLLEELDAQDDQPSPS